MIDVVAPGTRIKQTEDLKAPDNRRIKRVLIYRLGSLGDTVVALPALHLVARAFPNAERRMLTNVPVNSKAPAAAAVLDGTGLVNSYFKYSVGTRSLAKLALLWWQITRWGPQVVVYMAAYRGRGMALRDSRFFSLCGAWRQIGVPLTEAMEENRWSDVNSALEPEAERLIRNIAELGEGRLDDPANWDLRLSPEEIARARNALLAKNDLPLLAVSVGTKVQSKDWGASNWRGLLEALALQQPGYALALCGAGEEFAASEAAAEGWRTVSSMPVVNLCGKLTPRESAAVLAESKLFIGHDSGPMHLAAAVQTPCVAVFSARNKPRVWFPYGRQHRVVYHRVDCWGCGLEMCVVEKKKCITSISVAEVLAEIAAALGPS